MCAIINTLIPESDQHLISIYNIIPESSINVMRIKEMIFNGRTSRLLNKFFVPAHQEMYGGQYGDYAYWQAQVPGEHNFMAWFDATLVYEFYESNRRC